MKQRKKIRHEQYFWCTKTRRVSFGIFKRYETPRKKLKRTRRNSETFGWSELANWMWKWKLTKRKWKTLASRSKTRKKAKSKKKKAIPNWLDFPLSRAHRHYSVTHFYLRAHDTQPNKTAAKATQPSHDIQCVFAWSAHIYSHFRPKWCKLKRNGEREIPELASNTLNDGNRMFVLLPKKEIMVLQNCQIQNKIFFFKNNMDQSKGHPFILL